MTKKSLSVINSSDVSVACVEDDPVQLELMKHHLKNKRWKVTCFSTSDECLKSELEPDLLIIDLHLPGMDAIELYRLMKQKNRKLKCIIATASTEAADLTRSIRSGAESIILKPFSVTQMKQSIHKVLGMISQDRELQEYHNKLYDTIEHLSRHVEVKTRRLEYQLMTDSLTGLYNRARLEKSINIKKNQSLLYFNLIDFDQLNIAYGMMIGDELLRALADWFERNCPSNCMVFRLYADEFVILMENPEQDDDIVLTRTLLNKLWIQSFQVSKNLYLKAAIRVGIARSGITKNMIQSARLAEREARKKGISRYNLYDPKSEMVRQQKENLFYINAIRDALVGDGIIPYFQPIFDNRNGKIHKYEALARLKLNSKIIGPDKFIPPAKAAGYLPAITRRIIQRGLKIMSASDAGMTLNVSAEDFADGYLPDYLKAQIRFYSINPEKCTIEILEDIRPGEDLDRFVQLKELRAFGIKIAIDDFGVSDSNFSRIPDYQPDYMKIDRMFAMTLKSRAESENIIRLITEFGHSINAKLIAEGVDSLDTQKFISNTGIEYSQGYYLGRPISTLL